MFNALEPWHIIVLVILLIALFGYKRLPAAARGLGQSMRIFKSEAAKLRDGEGESGDSGQAPQQYGQPNNQFAQPGQFAQPQQYAQPQFAAPQQIAPVQPMQQAPMQAAPVQQPTAPVAAQAPAPAPAPAAQQPAATPEQH